MSEAAVAEVLERALRDRAFADQLASNPGAALAGYDLTDQERAAIRLGSAEPPTSAPLEERPSMATRLV